jgi:hypothetical protein
VRLAEEGLANALYRRTRKLSPGDVLVVNVTGSGFKDFDTLLAEVEVPSTIVGSYEDMERGATAFEGGL